MRSHYPMRDVHQTDTHIRNVRAQTPLGRAVIVQRLEILLNMPEG